MRIGLVVEWLDPARGGAETSTRQFIDQLLAGGVQLEVFTRSGLPGQPGMTVHTLNPGGASRAGRTGKFLDAAARESAMAGCDLVHAFVPCLGADIYQPRGGTVPETIQRTLASRPAGLRRAAKKLTMGLNRRQRLVLRRERAWLTGAERPMVIAISKYVAGQLKTHYSYPDGHIRHVFNGVAAVQAGAAERSADREAIRRRYGIAEDTTLVLQVCHNFRLKGVGRLLEAMALLPELATESIHALVVGRGASARWRKRATRLGVADRVTFTGPSDRVDAFYHASDVLVHPTYYDPCSRVTLEALVHGLPVVATQFDGASEVIDDGICGFVLHSPDDVKGLADRIVRLACPDLRRSMGEAAGSIGERISMKRHVNEVCAVYSSMLR